MQFVKKHKRFIGLTVSMLLFAALTVMLIQYVRAHAEDFEKLLYIAPGELAVIIALLVTINGLNGLKKRLIIRTLGARPTVADWLGTQAVSNLLCFVMPMNTQEIICAAYLKKRVGFAYGQYVAMTGGITLVAGCVLFFEVTFASLYALASGANVPIAFVLAGLGGLALCALIMILIARSGEKTIQRLPFKRCTVPVARGFQALLTTRGLLPRLVLLETLSAATHLFIMMRLFSVLGEPIQFSQAAYFSCISVLLTLLAIVPGNMGLREAALGSVSLGLGGALNLGVSVSILLRACEIITYFTLTMILIVPMIRGLAKKA